MRTLATLLLATISMTAVAQDFVVEELKVIDLRPAGEKDGTGLIALDGKCNKNVYRIADVASDPLKLDVLKEDVEPQLRALAGKKTLTVLDWNVYYNKQVQQTGGGLSGVGIQGYTIPGKKKERKGGSKCARADTAGGWYEESELHSSFYPLVSEFTGTFAGKPIEVRIVLSPTRKLTGKFEGADDDTEALLDIVHQTSEAVATAIVR